MKVTISHRVAIRLINKAQKSQSLIACGWEHAISDLRKHYPEIIGGELVRYIPQPKPKVTGALNRDHYYYEIALQFENDDNALLFQMRHL